ncbi:hypothetical protein OsccyDRAFT_1777 [Leptolyngbyaceae cyanobacterium JSC-12]|nr:hypothetical protein OsccyDRAFT_1777 [Leptolyngbyaceae cyanobacterium JSC-12]
MFKLRVSSDGQVVGYKAVNPIAMQKFGKRFPFLGVKFPQFPGLEKAPYADLKLESRGLVVRFSPWADNQ